MDALLETLPRVEMLCFLGDMDRDAAYLQTGLAEKQPRAAFYAVCGNNDPFSRLPATLELPFAQVRAMLTHGHLLRVKQGLTALSAQTKRRGCALALYGHTHIRGDEMVNGVRLVNPGALMLGCWALADIAGDGMEVTFMAPDS